VIIAETHRLILRTLNESDLDALMSVWGDQEVMRYSGGAGTREREENALKFYITLYKENGYSPYAVIEKKNQGFLGVCGFNPPSENGEIELVYHFAKKHWGMGYATEAAEACIDYAKNHFLTDKIAAFIDPENIGSENVLKKLGFEYKGAKFHQGSQKIEPYFVLTL